MPRFAAFCRPAARKIAFRLLLLTAGSWILLPDALRAEECRTDCVETIFKPCPCPSGCTETFCEKACVWIGCHSCIAQCRSCSCGGFGEAPCKKPVFPTLLTDKFQLLPLISEAWAAEPSSAPAVKEVQNAMGDFLIFQGGNKAAEEDGGRVGVKLAIKDGITVITDVDKDSPADKAGLKEKQVVVSIDGRSTNGMPLETAVRALRGKAGTLVVLRIKSELNRNGKKVPLIRAASWGQPKPKSLNGVTLKEIPHKELGQAACPATHEGCLLLDAGEYCSYSCRSKN